LFQIKFRKIIEKIRRESLVDPRKNIANKIEFNKNNF
jgi:hypothetical protein